MLVQINEQRKKVKIIYSEHKIYKCGKLRNKIKEVYGTHENFAKALGIGRVSLSMRLNNKIDFTRGEMIDTCTLLGIKQEDIGNYFFEIKVQKREQKNKGRGVNL